MDPAGDETSKETQVRKPQTWKCRSVLLPWNDPYQNNCSLSMHEYQRIVVERNNELAQHVIIIHMFDKYKRVLGGGIQPTKREEERRVIQRKGRRALLICVCQHLLWYISGVKMQGYLNSSPSSLNNFTFQTLKGETEIYKQLFNYF